MILCGFLWVSQYKTLYLLEYYPIVPYRNHTHLRAVACLCLFDLMNCWVFPLPHYPHSIKHLHGTLTGHKVEGAAAPKTTHPPPAPPHHMARMARVLVGGFFAGGGRPPPPPRETLGTGASTSRTYAINARLFGCSFTCPCVRDARDANDARPKHPPRPAGHPNRSSAHPPGRRCDQA